MLIFNGEKRKSLFNKPFSSVEYGIKNNVETVPLNQKVDKTQDDRARTILQALVIESLTDEISHSFVFRIQFLNTTLVDMWFKTWA